MKKLLLLAFLALGGLKGQNILLLAGTGGAAPSPVATPTDSPGTGTYSSAQTVFLSESTSGAAVCYRTDGVAPTATVPGICDSPAITYSGSFTISSNTTLTALGTKSGLVNSGVLTSVYIISAGISLKDSKSGSSTGGTLGAVATTPALNCTGATMITLTFWSISDPAVHVTPSDSVGGNTYVAISPTATTSFSVLLSATFVSTGTVHVSGAQTFTGTPNDISLLAVSAACWGGVTVLDNASPVDNTHGAGSATACTTGNSTASGSPSLFLTTLTDNNGSDAITAPTSYTKIEDIKAVGGNSVGGALAWFTSSSTQGPTWNYTSGSQNVCQAISFK